MKTRGSGILLHITSLPSPHGIGDLGPWAYKFADFLAETKQSYWQILPLNPSATIYGNSPYFSISAFAANPLLISLDFLVQDGLLDRGDLEPVPEWPNARVDYHKVTGYKINLLHRAYERFKKNKGDCNFEQFCEEQASWLEDFALFVSLMDHFQGVAWSKWPPDVRDRKAEALQFFRKELHERIEREEFIQYVFSRQWRALKKYCNRRDIHIIGDIPIYVEYQSADLWANPELFKLDQNKEPSVVSGVPPDYFSETGQLWGNPVYRWEVLKQRKYDWWIQRIERNIQLFDFVRIDHFRGFVAYWEVPASEKTAVTGKWVEAPAADFFMHLSRRFPSLPLIAEDLGIITPDVREIMQCFEFPGMKVLLFAFGGDPNTNPYLLHNIIRNSIVYTGTHDNNTAKGWFEKEAPPDIKKRLFEYLGHEMPGNDIHWELIRLAMISSANVAIIPMQDVLGLGEESRMNRPSVQKGNWEWRLLEEQLTSSLAARLRSITGIYGRAQ